MNTKTVIIKLVSMSEDTNPIPKVMTVPRKELFLTLTI